MTCDHHVIDFRKDLEKSTHLQFGACVSWHMLLAIFLTAENNGYYTIMTYSEDLPEVAAVFFHKMFVSTEQR